MTPAPYQPGQTFWGFLQSTQGTNPVDFAQKYETALIFGLAAAVLIGGIYVMGRRRA